MSKVKLSRLSGIHKLALHERIAKLADHGWLSNADADALLNGRQVLSLAAADKMVENVVGVFGLPLAVAPNFIVNGRDCIVPLVVEEPSVVAALSNAAAKARTTGGFVANATSSLLCGQVHLLGVDDPAKAIASLQSARQRLLDQANKVHPRLSVRGGGVRDFEWRTEQLPDGKPLLIVHTLVDTCDAMGANMVNTICEAIAPSLVELTGGDAVLRILSNLTDKSLVTASVTYAIDDLDSGELDGATVRDRIVTANDIAIVDTYRAATHNKGIMNGIDPLAIATGNDWRALESAAHAFAARNGKYSSLTRWSVGPGGDLIGEIEVPLKVGVVGGTISSNAAAQLSLALAGVTSAQQLAELMAAVGLAQNFSAIKALVTSGIQEGHMRLHARSASKEQVPAAKSDRQDGTVGSAAGKVILFGEHAVVYGCRALALPIPDAVQASVRTAMDATVLEVPAWGLSADTTADDGAAAAVNLIKQELGVADQHFSIYVDSELPRGAGLGSSAAIAVAVTRAIAAHLDMQIDAQRVNEIAYVCEELAHGTPSGLDNTVSTLSQPLIYHKESEPTFTTIDVTEQLPLVIGICNRSTPTHIQVAAVRQRYEQQQADYEQIFSQIDALSEKGRAALRANDYQSLGRAMNVCHGLLNAIEVSSPELEGMIAVARKAGAAGAKLTGGGGGGAMVALCPGREDQVRSALQQAGYQVLRKTGNKG